MEGHETADRPSRSTGSHHLREWHRDFPERKIAGVCAGVADQFGLPLTAVRVAFVLLTLLPGFHAIGVGLYLALWFLMPERDGGESGLDRVVDAVATLAGSDGRDAGRGRRTDPQREGLEDELERY